MINLENEKGNRIGILGLARTGEAAYLALKDFCNVICHDDSEKNSTDFAAKYGADKLVNITDPAWERLDKIILSPGIPTSLPKPHPIMEIARKNNIPISSDIDLLYNASPDAHYIAITGTNGKSTTTALIHHILKEHNYDIGGNIGKPALGMNHAARGYVLELSSFQIELLQTFKADIAIITNITPDHLDRHGTIENYINVKKSLVENCANSILNVEFAATKAIYESSSHVIPFSTRNLVEKGACVMNGKIYDCFSGMMKEYDLPESKYLQGEHNRENIAAAFAACRLTGLDAAEILEKIASFVSLPHRMQFLGTKFGIDFYNDSKATNAEAAEKSIGSLKNIYLLAGGVPKDGGLAPILHLRQNITKAYLYGQAKNLFAEQLEGIIPYQICDTLDESFAAAVCDAKTSPLPTNILLAPACASYDQFKDFEERGCHFMSLYDRMTPHHKSNK